MVVGKSQVCNECCHLKIRCLLVPAWGQQGPKQKVESDAEEMVQPKQLKAIVEVAGMTPELTMLEVLLEQLELLSDLRGLMTSQLEELKGLRWAISVMGFSLDEIVKWMSQMEEGSRSRNDRARST